MTRVGAARSSPAGVAPRPGCSRDNHSGSRGGAPRPPAGQDEDSGNMSSARLGARRCWHISARLPANTESRRAPSPSTVV